MRRLALAALAAVLAAVLPAPASVAGTWTDHADLPWPVSNNAVTTHVLAGTTFVYTFFGIDSTKSAAGISKSAARLNTVTDTWQVLPDVPVASPRIAASAVTVRDTVYVLGGYSVDSTGAETTRPQVRAFDPAAGAWISNPPNMPRRVDDMVAGVWADSLIYLVSGWSVALNVPDVQFFDPATWSWSTATPLPAFGTFGATGGVCGDHIVFVDGVADTALFGFDLVNRVLVGTIDPMDAANITWEDRGPHPGQPVYRGAAWNVPDDGTRIVVAGGTDNPYNFDGIGYDGNPSAPLGQVWSYHVPTGTVVFHADKPVPTMDHRGFPAGADGRHWIVGGMEAGQTVTARVSSWIPDPVTGAPELPRPALAITAFPNPAVAGVRFVWPGGSAARAARIVDVAGRTVRARPFAEAGIGSGTWDLRNGSGRRVPPGVYWLVARIGERTAAVPVVVAD